MQPDAKRRGTIANVILVVIALVAIAVKGTGTSDGEATSASSTSVASGVSDTSGVPVGSGASVVPAEVPGTGSTRPQAPPNVAASGEEEGSEEDVRPPVYNPDTQAAIAVAEQVAVLLVGFPNQLGDMTALLEAYVGQLAPLVTSEQLDLIRGEWNEAITQNAGLNLYYRAQIVPVSYVYDETDVKKEVYVNIRRTQVNTSGATHAVDLPRIYTLAKLDGAWKVEWVSMPPGTDDG